MLPSIYARLKNLKIIGDHEAIAFHNILLCHAQFRMGFSIFLGVHSAKTHRLVRILYDTRPTHTNKLQELALPTQRSFEIPLPHGSRATVQLLLPPSWREELRDAAFPVLVEV